MQAAVGASRRAGSENPGKASIESRPHTHTHARASKIRDHGSVHILTSAFDELVVDVVGGVVAVIVVPVGPGSGVRPLHASGSIRDAGHHAHRGHEDDQHQHRP